MKHIVAIFALLLLIATGISCDVADTRIVNKSFDDLSWVERTRSPVALAMAERHFSYCAMLRHAYKDASAAYEKASAPAEDGRSASMMDLFKFKGLEQEYKRDLISNLWEVLFYKPDHRPAVYELISLLEQQWFEQAEAGMGAEAEIKNLAMLEKALRNATNFYGRDYEISYKLGAILYRESKILEVLPDLGEVVEKTVGLGAGQMGPATHDGRLGDAIGFLKKSIAVRSMYAEAYQLLALSLEDLERDKEAYKFWKLITVVEQATKRDGSVKITADQEGLFQTARDRVAMYEDKYGPV